MGNVAHIGRADAVAANVKGVRTEQCLDIVAKNLVHLPIVALLDSRGSC